MATNAKYLITTSTGSYIDWSYAKIPGFSIQNKTAAIVGGVGNDAVYVGAGSSVDFTDTGAGNDSPDIIGAMAAASSTMLNSPSTNCEMVSSALSPSSSATVGRSGAVSSSKQTGRSKTRLLRLPAVGGSSEIRLMEWIS